MKRVIVVLAALMFLSSGFAFAANDVKVEVGIKLWNNEWENKDPIDGTTKFDAALLLGPAVVVTLPSNVFFEASYLMSGTDYEKKEGTATIEVERTDMDFAVGYMFIPQVGVFVGYRNSSMDVTFPGGSSTIDVTGPLVGVRGNVDMNEMFGVYGNIAYLMFESETSEAGATATEDETGTLFELGVKANFSKQLSGTLGYKVEATEGDKSKTENTFSGFTLGVMYAF